MVSSRPGQSQLQLNNQIARRASLPVKVSLAEPNPVRTSREVTCYKLAKSPVAELEGENNQDSPK